jgi:Flp pilus assembly pilin Flp
VNTLLVKLRLGFLELVEKTDGQDMVEYVLVFALLALGATTATDFLAIGLAGAFNGLSTTMASYTS